MKYVDFKDILRVIAKSARRSEIVEIYYPKTDKSKAGWREVEPYSLTTDIGADGEHLVYGKDRLSPGHIFNAYSIKKRVKNCDSFIIGKIKDAKPTKKKFKPRNKWKIEF